MIQFIYMEFAAVTPKIDRYIDGLLIEKDPVLRQMQKLGTQRDFPIVGPQVGRVLYILAKLIGARRIFEMGSGFGYSAFWFAKALPLGGKVYQTESSEKNSKQAQDFFNRAGLVKKAEFLAGDALELIDQVKGTFDIVFIDMDKESYPVAFKKAKRRIRKGGLILADNVLWFGKVMEKLPDAQTQGILEFTRLLFNDPEFFATLLPIRDGVAMGYKQ